MAQKRFYFAYGESMNISRLKKWLFQRGGRPDGIITTQPAVLKGYKLVFNVHCQVPWNAGTANLKEHKKGHVEGVLMEIDSTIEGLIQKKEGIPINAKRLEVTVTGDQDKTHEKVTTYISTRAEEGKSHAPTKAYMALVLEAAKDFEFSDGYVKSLKEIKTTD